MKLKYNQRTPKRLDYLLITFDKWSFHQVDAIWDGRKDVSWNCRMAFGNIAEIQIKASTHNS